MQRKKTQCRCICTDLKTCQTPFQSANLERSVFVVDYRCTRQSARLRAARCLNYRRTSCASTSNRSGTTRSATCSAPTSTCTTCSSSGTVASFKSASLVQTVVLMLMHSVKCDLHIRKRSRIYCLKRRKNTLRSKKT